MSNFGRKHVSNFKNLENALLVKGHLADQLAVLLARAGGRALRRRRALPSDHISLQRDAVTALCLDP